MRPIQCFAAVLLFLSTFMNVPAQQKPTPEAVEMMKRVEFLSGRWSGGGWIMLGPGQKHTFTGTETASSKLDGTILVIEGLHTIPGEAGAPERVIHNALGVISFDVATKKLKFQSYLADGRSITTEADAPDNRTFIWWMKDPRGNTTRFTSHLEDNGDWVDTGEFSMDGKEWRKFYEMRMKKVK